MLSWAHIISICITIFVVTLVGVYSMRQVKNASDFSVGGRSISTSLVAGTIVGTIVGGASTVGTAQLAFQYGFSAWWFTLGAGIACLLLGLFLARPLREANVSTGPQFLALSYGESATLYASVFSSIGIFLNIVGQILAAVALLTSIFPIPPFLAALIAVVLVISYVVFGGVWGTGMVGVVKMFLVYLSMAVAGIVAWKSAGGISGYTHNFETYPWFSLFGRGYSKDLAAGFSLIVGVLSTQTYLQAMFSGKSIKDSRNGAFISALLIPPIGLAGIFIGMYMRMYFPTIRPAEALPMFILNNLNPWFGGIVLATLLISVIGTGAGLTLGISTMLSQDIYKKKINPLASDDQVLKVSRIFIVIVTMVTLLFVSGNLNSLILKWSILSMGLRGATICLPLLAAIFLNNKIAPTAGVLALIFAPSATICWVIFGDKAIDPLYIGLLVSSFFLLTGFIVEKNKFSLYEGVKK